MCVGGVKVKGRGCKYLSNRGPQTVDVDFLIHKLFSKVESCCALHETNEVKRSASTKKQQQQQQQKTHTENDTVLNTNIMITISIGSPISSLDMYQYCQKRPSTTSSVIEYNIVHSALPLPIKIYIKCNNKFL